MKFRILTFVILIAGFFCSAHATELVHNFINPSFGGYYYNATWLMSSAQAQDKTGETSSAYTSSYYSQNSLEDFEESINRQILSRLSSKLVTQIFGEEELEPGHYEIGDFTIDVTPSDQGIRVEIQDPTTGGETIIELPYYGE